MSVVNPHAALVPRLCVLAAGTALAVTGCSSDKTSGLPDGTTSPTPTSSPSSVPLPSGTDVTAPGTALAFGDTATVPYQIGKRGTVLDLTVKSAAQGSIDDFKGFDMSDPYKRKG